jgi:hypothetical protein
MPLCTSDFVDDKYFHKGKVSIKVIHFTDHSKMIKVMYISYKATWLMRDSVMFLSILILEAIKNFCSFMRSSNTAVAMWHFTLYHFIKN